ncbi:hypothetical protein PG985_002886 [Apiospora marii]|uniref:uncharacterized protein n=1 Tax=Apiospora marii TaxID=335849 RepID=UPI00312F58B5
MCVTLFTHYCSAEHETRPLCTLDPATDCTVFNPYAEPWRNPCPTPCLGKGGVLGGDVSAIPGHRCPWHGDCCRIIRSSMCGTFDPGQCPNDVSYHLRREPTRGAFGVGEEADDLTLTEFPPLPMFNEEPWFVALRWDFFQAATDLYNVGARRTSYAAAVKQARNLLLPSCMTKKDRQRAPRRKKVTDVDRRYIETGRKYRTIALYLGQLAQVWDRNAAYGLCPPRPGRQPNPSLAWPAYAQVDPERGVWSIGYELARNVRNSVVKPPAHQELFAAHHFPHRVGIPEPAPYSSSSSPSGVWDDTIVKTRIKAENEYVDMPPPGAWNDITVKTRNKAEDEDVDMESITPALTSIYPPPPSPPPAPYANTSHSFVTPRISALSLSPHPGSQHYNTPGIGQASQ